MTKQTWSAPSDLDRYRMLDHGESGIEIRYGHVPRGEPMSPARFRWIFHNYYYPSRIHFLDQQGTQRQASSVTWVGMENTTHRG